MGAVIFKQPNGFLGRYSYTSDGFTHYNMSEEEYIVTKIEDSIHDSKDTIKHHKYDYDSVVEDAKEHINVWDEYIKESEDDEEKQKYIEEQRKMKEEYDNLISLMNNPPSENDKICHAYYKELLKMINNLVCLYDDEWNRKEYRIIDNESDVVKMTKKIKEINKIFNELKDENRQKS